MIESIFTSLNFVWQRCRQPDAARAHADAIETIMRWNGVATSQRYIVVMFPRGVYIIHANKKLFFFARATNSFGGMRAGDRASTYTISIPFTLARTHTLRPRFARFACPFYGLSLSFDVSYGTVCAHSSALSKGVGCLCTGNNASN